MPVYKDASNDTWYVSVRYTDWAGNHARKVKRGFKKQGEAKSWERDFLQQESKTCDMALSALIELYLKDLSTRIKESTMQTKRNIIDMHITPYLGKTPVNKIDPASIRRWQSEVMSEKAPDGSSKYAPTFLRSINSQFSAIMNYAVRYYHLNQNPFTVTGSMGRKKAGEMKIWTVDQFNAAIVYEDNIAKKIALEILFWGGLRIGECLSLCPVDVIENNLKVNKTYKGSEKSTDPKTANSYRIVPMPDSVINALNDYITRLYGLQPEDRIFYFGKGTLNKELDDLADKAGLEHIRIHDLRHSHASLLIKLGFSVAAVAKRLGDTIEVVMNTYAHLYPGDQVHMVNKLTAVKDGINSLTEETKKALLGDETPVKTD